MTAEFPTHDYTVRPRADGSRPQALLSRKHRERLLRELTDRVGPALREAGILPGEGSAALAAWIGEFYGRYPERPVESNTGGSGFNDALWLFAVARAIRPVRLIESGVLRGLSSWVLHIACPEAPIDGFDADLSKVAWRHPNVTLHQADWSAVMGWEARNADSLCFFDDHINQCRRVAEAYERGFRWLLMDDNFPVTQVHATGGPPLPTLAMLFDPELDEGEEVAWTRKGKDYSWVYTRAAEFGARDLIELYRPLPDLADLTGYPRQSGLSLVRLRSRPDDPTEP